MKAAQQATSSATIACTVNCMVCLSHATPIGWVMDSGASDHVINNVSLFYELSPPKYPHYITVAAGSKVEATSVGRVSHIPSLSLSYILLIPNFPFNLISIRKLTSSLIRFITFTFIPFLYRTGVWDKRLELELNLAVFIIFNNPLPLYVLLLNVTIFCTIA